MADWGGSIAPFLLAGFCPSGDIGSLGHVLLQMRSVVCPLFLNDTEAHGHAEGTHGSDFGALFWRLESAHISRNSQRLPVHGPVRQQRLGDHPSRRYSASSHRCPLCHTKTPSTRAVSSQKSQDSPANLQNGVGAGSSSIRTRLVCNLGSATPGLGRGNGAQGGKRRWCLVFPAKLEASFTGSGGVGDILLGGLSQLR